jgi:hypothetical protein
MQEVERGGLVDAGFTASSSVGIVFVVGDAAVVVKAAFFLPEGRMVNGCSRSCCCCFGLWSFIHSILLHQGLHFLLTSHVIMIIIITFINCDDVNNSL